MWTAAAAREGRFGRTPAGRIPGFNDASAQAVTSLVFSRTLAQRSVEAARHVRPSRHVVGRFRLMVGLPHVPVVALLVVEGLGLGVVWQRRWDFGSPGGGSAL